MDYSSNFRKVLKIAKERTTTGLIEPNHLLVGVILTEESVGYQMLEILIDMKDAKEKVKELYNSKLEATTTIDTSDELAKLTAQSEQIMMQAQLEAKQAGSDVVRTEHMILSFVRSNMLESVTYAEDDFIMNINMISGRVVQTSMPRVILVQMIQKLDKKPEIVQTHTEWAGN